MLQPYIESATALSDMMSLKTKYQLIIGLYSQTI